MLHSKLVELLKKVITWICNIFCFKHNAGHFSYPFMRLIWSSHWQVTKIGIKWEIRAWNLGKHFLSWYLQSCRFVWKNHDVERVDCSIDIMYAMIFWKIIDIPICLHNFFCLYTSSYYQFHVVWRDSHVIIIRTTNRPSRDRKTMTCLSSVELRSNSL